MPYGGVVTSRALATHITALRCHATSLAICHTPLRAIDGDITLQAEGITIIRLRHDYAIRRHAIRHTPPRCRHYIIHTLRYADTTLAEYYAATMPH